MDTNTAGIFKRKQAAKEHMRASDVDSYYAAARESATDAGVDAPWLPLRKHGGSGRVCACERGSPINCFTSNIRNPSE